MARRRRLHFGLKVALPSALGLALVAALGWYLYNHTVAVLAPAGPVAEKERALIIVAIVLSVIVVVPVYALTIAIVWKYRATNHRATYMPEWDRSKVYESIWWGVPMAIITVLSVITWQSAHALDPFKALDGTTARPMPVEVVALEWKWLFIYPEQHVASVNLLELPVNTPINFYITADAPMNSFWIPRLGSQIYAMPGMSTQVHLMATQTGNYYGSSANISGTGFASMAFTAHAVSSAEFATWTKATQGSPQRLDQNMYTSLARPSTLDHPSFYSSVDPSLYNGIIMKYMMPMSGPSMADMPGMNMGTQ